MEDFEPKPYTLGKENQKMIYHKDGKVYKKIGAHEIIQKGALHSWNGGPLNPIMGPDTVGGTPILFAPQRDFYNPAVVIKAVGTRFFGKNKDAWVTWWLLEPTDADEEEIKTQLDAWPMNSGPGYVFTNKAIIRRTKTRVLVTQRGGLDI